VRNTTEKPGREILISLLIGIHLSALPLYAGLPIPVTLLLFSLSLWQFLLITQNRPNPGKIVLLSIIVLSFLIVRYSFGHVFGQQPGIALVTLMTILKLFETKSHRDCYIVIYSAFFIIASNFFHSQSIWLIIYVFFVVTSLVSILIALSDRLNTVPLAHRFKMSSRFIFYAIPMMLVLFFLFPRIPGPLWGLPDDAFTSQTGLSEEMSPGSINRLINSSAIAFRVKFEQQVPRHSQLYWRGAVLSDYDGRTWRRNDAPASAEPNIQYDENPENRFRYTVTLEATNLSWLLSLEYPKPANASTHDLKYSLNREAMLLTKDKINKVTSYTIESQTGSINRALFDQESYKNRLLPLQLNPRTLALSRQLLQSSANDAQRYISNVLSYFRDNGFIYTLTPDLLGDDAMDDFIFTSRRGFCEHYASAFTYLMRAAGIPSRVVVGYQGGKMNPLDDYMIVRQSDAHAWSEIWINGSWQRVDPTAVISPDRIERGILNAGLENSQLPLLLLSDNSFIRNATFLYDSFQNRWNQWVIGYDQKKQYDLLKSLGLENSSPSNLILLLVICLTLTAMIISWFILTKNTVEKDRVQHHYNLLCKKLQRQGIQRNLNEGPVDFENRIYDEQALSDRTKHDLMFIFKAYRSLHYGSQSNNDLVKNYLKKIRKLKIRKQRSEPGDD
jgi:transglutaminase-like putative cysteine protease